MHHRNAGPPSSSQRNSEDAPLHRRTSAEVRVPSFISQVAPRRCNQRTSGRGLRRCRCLRGGSVVATAIGPAGLGFRWCHSPVADRWSSLPPAPLLHCSPLVQPSVAPPVLPLTRGA
ncbi:Os03g0229000 [Oryza sativa Japonica Group]|uniref:Os03g0229000 protein n=2 Tax=Oryza sativa subsp. japonica TaxID=39947 RepID=C7J0G6_ORYSJ|nr:hypothetical protein EE612_016264 [Oryza sativa]BAH92054.1 Os03g0228900 [Oryza sativa Japonica Group]BAS83089.1 Os03g0229000 [Oryza sativa Japonica Group]|eukprot:NP_001173326.1 Os03g0228900 [Oryza sativa Japonica Group]